MSAGSREECRQGALSRGACCDEVDEVSVRCSVAAAVNGGDGTAREAQDMKGNARCGCRTNKQTNKQTNEQTNKQNNR